MAECKHGWAPNYVAQYCVLCKVEALEASNAILREALEGIAWSAGSNTAAVLPHIKHQAEYALALEKGMVEVMPLTACQGRYNSSVCKGINQVRPGCVLQYYCELREVKSDRLDSKGIELIAAERWRQVEEERWNAVHDACHENDELLWAAICYAAPDRVYIKEEFEEGVTFGDPWPVEWGAKSDKRKKHDRKRRLVIAGALIAAEIDRLSAREMISNVK